MPLGGAGGGPRLRYYLRQRKARLSWPTGSSAAAGPTTPPPPPLPRINEDLRNCTWLRVASSRAIGPPRLGLFSYYVFMMSVLKLQNTFLVVSVSVACASEVRVRRGAWRPPCGSVASGPHSRTRILLFRLSHDSLDKNSTLRTSHVSGRSLAEPPARAERGEGQKVKIENVILENLVYTR